MSCEVVRRKLWVVSCEVVRWKYFSLWRDSSLLYASFRMTGFCFLLTIRNLYYWGNCFWKAKIFIIELLFKWAKLAKFIRYEAVWKLSLFFITKFSEMLWNDSVFEGTEEHRRCSGKVTDFRLESVEKFFPLWRDSSLLYASFRMTWFCFLLTIRNLYHWGNYFWNAKIFFLELLF